MLLFSGSDFDHLPPCSDSLNDHTLKLNTNVTRGVDWGKALIPCPTILDPSHWGWHMVSKRWQPLGISKTVISEALKQLVSCGCAKKYKLPCKCCVAVVSCTPSAPVVALATRTDVHILWTNTHLESSYTSVFNKI